MKIIVGFLGLGLLVSLIINYIDIIKIIIKALVVLVPIFFIVWIYCSRKQAKLDAIQKEKEYRQRELLNTLNARKEFLIQEKIYDSKYFAKFINSIFRKFSNNYGEWPDSRQYEFNDKVLEPFQMILEDEYNETFSLKDIRECVVDKINVTKQDCFNKSFELLVCKQSWSGCENNLEKIVSLYCDVFGEDDSLFDELTNYMHMKLLEENGDIDKLYYLRYTLEKEIENRKKKHKVEVYKQKLDSGIGILDAITIFQIDTLGGLEFEKIIGSLYENMGYTANVTKGSCDQGGDVVVEKQGVRTVIQVKRYSNTVGNKAVQEVIASKSYYDCEEAVVITNNYFSNAANELAAVNRVKLIDRDELVNLLEKYPVVK